jgi:hypothetical protein
MRTEGNWILRVAELVVFGERTTPGLFPEKLMTHEDRKRVLRVCESGLFIEKRRFG